MIGGTDIILAVRRNIPAADVIFRTIRRHWPNFVFQNADDDSAPFTPQVGPWLPQPSGREFFIYRDADAARSWDAYGATPENRNAMIYVILGKEPPPGADLGSVTLVCGDLTEEIRTILDEIARGFTDYMEGPGPLWEAA
jgi:hypothetical protein